MTQVHLPVTEALAQEVLSLPMYPELSNEEIASVVHSVQQAMLDLEE